MTLRTFDRGAPVEAIVVVLVRDGGAIVLDFLTPEAVAGLTSSGWSVFP